MFLGEKGYSYAILCHFGPNFMNFANFVKSSLIEYEKRVLIFKNDLSEQWVVKTGAYRAP